MKKFTLFLMFLATCSSHAFAQKLIDSLQKAYKNNRQDTTLVRILDAKSIITYGQNNTDSGMICARQGLALSRRINYKYGEVRCLADMAQHLNAIGDLPGALRVSFEVLRDAIAMNEAYTIGQCYNTLGLTYLTLNDLKKSNEYYYKALPYALRSGVNSQADAIYNNLSRNFTDLNMLDSAQWYADKGYAMAVDKHLEKDIGYILRNFGIIQFKKGNYRAAIGFYNKSLAHKISRNIHYLRSENFRRTAEAYQKLNMLDSSAFFGKQALDEARLGRNPSIVISAASMLSDVFDAKKDFQQAYQYQRMMLAAKDSLFSQQKTLQIKNVEFNEQKHQEEIRAAEAEYRNKVRFYALLGVIGIIALIAVILIYVNQSRKKINERLRLQNQQIQDQHSAMEQTLGELKSTQTQLIQSAKMASLGELTAGIAHEIQNPLNFVNNFSEVSIELMDELNAELDAIDHAEAKAITADVIENLGKINHHGKRAESIVKGMLEHSRKPTGRKELTDLNKLAEDYMHLAYNGQQTKDRDFNIDLITNLDPTLPKVAILSQDIGRVVLNMVNNAFYAVKQKAKIAGRDYKPTVTISTMLEDRNAIITVTDNGTGISDAIRDKIVQPFFTTKPTGEGIGLGLSISYDIVVQGHGGQILVDSVEGEFSSFRVVLPVGEGDREKLIKKCR